MKHTAGAAEATYEWSGLRKVENARAKCAPKRFASLIFISTCLPRNEATTTT